jgi:hypothetical protein
MIKLKNGTLTEDQKLDRIVSWDERSRNYPIRSLVSMKKPRSYTWRCNAWHDQGQEGACVGFGMAHELAARPAEVKQTDASMARVLYWEAQKIDPWDGGSYPGASPFYEGTSVLAGVKVVQELGYMESYRWAFGIEDLILGVGYNGPAVLGINWYEGMYNTDSDGYIHPTGNKVGGHCLLCRSISIKKQHFILRNSWGKGWGINGDCYISINDMKKLLEEDGEAVFFQRRKSMVER